VRGRLFGDDEFRGNPPTAVILSHGYWTRRFGADPAVVGTSLVMNGVARTIVGVMPEHFNYPDARSDLWVPMPRFNPDSLGDRANNYLFMVGRMKPGVSVDHLRADANVEAARIVRDNPQSFDPKHPLRPHIEVVSNQLVKNARPYLMALLGTVGLVLLIACANVANLLLARAEGRRREMALRSALGASGRRLVTQLVTECGVVALIGGAIGLMSAWAATHVLVAFAPGAIPRIDEVRVDWRVVVFTFAASAFTAIVISLVPAFRALRDDSYEALRSGTRSLAVGIAGGARRALVIAQVALAVVALSGAGMLLRSLWHLQSTDTGFDTRHVLTARVAIAARQYNDAGAAQFFETLMDRIRSTPGVTAAGAAGWLPVVDAGGLWGIIPEGRAYGPGSGSPADQPASVPQQITPGYFAAAGIRIIAGRDFTNADRDGAPYVAIVSKEMAKTIWPGEDAIGKRFRVGGGDQLPLMTVVGVVGDIRSRGYADHPEPTMYFPFAQTGRTTYFMPRAMGVLVRTTANPRSAEASVRAIIRSLDPGAPVSEVRTLEEVVGTSITTRRFSTSLLAMFAALALLLAGIGTYGVIAYGVAQRTYEIGVRIALGAERRTVLALVMSEGLVMCGAGLGIGLVAAVFIARALRSMLVDVPVIDAVSLGMTAIALALVAMLASVIPARRAMKVSPLSALNAS
ncbi:MAG TPA: ABC transporter permease, partial [Gemmatimonadaceae bacterium]|nr:ABC transporter permease [Gemmatimonadaceae bacterium]